MPVQITQCHCEEKKEQKPPTLFSFFWKQTQDPACKRKQRQLEKEADPRIPIDFSYRGAIEKT